MSLSYCVRWFVNGTTDANTSVIELCESGCVGKEREACQVPPNMNENARLPIDFQGSANPLLRVMEYGSVKY